MANRAHIPSLGHSDMKILGSLNYGKSEGELLARQLDEFKEPQP